MLACTVFLLGLVCTCYYNIKWNAYRSFLPEYGLHLISQKVLCIVYSNFSFEKLLTLLVVVVSYDSIKPVSIRLKPKQQFKNPS